MTSLTRVPCYPENWTVEQIEDLGRREEAFGKTLMQAYQQRVVDEKAALEEKISRLTNFLDGETFKTLPVDEQDRMKRQLHIMSEYSAVLGERIEAFAP